MAGDSANGPARQQRDTGTNEEMQTAAALSALPRERWRVLQDVPWPGRPRAVIDHVVVGPPGVFVIESKHWSGTVAVKDGVLRQGRYSRQAVVSSAAEAARAVAGHLRTTRCPVRPVLCLDRSDRIAAECDGVLVCSAANLEELLRARPAVLADIQVQRLVRDLAGHGLPFVTPPVGSRPTTHGVRYLVGSLAAMAVTLTLVLSPEAVREGVEDVATWIAD